MAGIQEKDVWQVADALLLEGGRPTIERVRQKLGRGSPNTVSGHLETWFKHLGARIKDPGAFAAPPDVPDPVLQAAQHFWNTALAQTRADIDQRLHEGLQAAIANVEAEKERATIAEAAAFDISTRFTHAQAELEDLRDELQRGRLAAAASEARLQEARAQLEDMRARVQQAETRLAAAREAAQQEVANAQERSAAVERRAMLDIDAERTARGKSDKRAESLEAGLQAVTAHAQAALAQHAERSATARAEIAQLTAALASAEAGAEVHRQEVVALTRELEEARSQARAATSQADLADRVIAAFKANAPKAAKPRRATKRAVGA